MQCSAVTTDFAKHSLLVLVVTQRRLHAKAAPRTVASRVTLRAYWPGVSIPTMAEHRVHAQLALAPGGAAPLKPAKALSMPRSITAVMLYDLVQCPHRVTMDLRGDPSVRDEVSGFVQLLWEKGAQFEQDMIGGLDEEFVDLVESSDEERAELTLRAMDDEVPLIYRGRIQADDLLGEPDLLRLENGGYVAGDIKSGAGEEGTEDLAKPKKHYAVQLAIYTDILERLGRSPGRYAFIWDINREEVVYDLAAPQGPRKPESLWDEYEKALASARAIVADAGPTLPAYGSVCKLCHWYSVCRSAMEQANDLSLIPGLGRNRRDAMFQRVETIRAFAESDPETFIVGTNTVFPGVGAGMLRKFHDRAQLLTDPNATPYLSGPVDLPRSDLELFFDIEVDPMRDVCYLHGFVERHDQDNETERYVPFLTEEPTQAAEEAAFADAWNYVQSFGDAIIYYYGSYERTWWRKLQARYPHVCSEADIEAMFDGTRTVDLYTSVIRSKTEWPTNDHSIKTLAKYLGFDWRDTHPSGAASIEWFHRWVETGDGEIRQRILDYNADDCVATRVVLDGVRAFS